MLYVYNLGALLYRQLMNNGTLRNTRHKGALPYRQLMNIRSIHPHPALRALPYRQLMNCKLGSLYTSHSALPYRQFIDECQLAELAAPHRITIIKSVESGKCCWQIRAILLLKKG